jgi:hypothetical protein
MYGDVMSRVNGPSNNPFFKDKISRDARRTVAVVFGSSRALKSMIQGKKMPHTQVLS